MNKKMNWLAVIPIYGSVILLLWLFIKAIKYEIERRQFNTILTSCAIVGFLSIFFSVLLMKFLNTLAGASGFLNDYGLVIAFVLGGYLLNLFTFRLVHKQL